MISRETINRVFETARVEEVIGEFVTLKKSGSNYKGISPFSNERTPSFMVSPVKQIWKDFSSGKGGSAISFLMEHEHYSYPEAIRYLAKKYNIEIEETEQTDEEKKKAGERESMYLVSEFARDEFQYNLFETQQGKAIGLSYFKERDFTEETIKKFQLGYSLDQWEGFTKVALKKGYDLTYLEKVGLTIVKEKKQFDRFKGRVMFPIHSMSGRVLGFGGRILTSDKKAAKYLNSPESDIYHKSKILYGIYYAKQEIAKEDNCYLVEGYTDVISFHQSGVKNVVASSGTALTEDQIRLIRRLTQNITILYDGDAAGIRASFRGIDLILEQGMNVKVLTFPEGEDPDSFARKNSDSVLKAYLNENVQDFINFKVSLLLEDAQNDPVKKAGLIRDIVHSISKIPNDIQREVYIRECSNIMDISEDALFRELAQIDKKIQRDASKKKTAEIQRTTTSTLEKTAPVEIQKIDELKKYEREIVKILLLYGEKETDFEDYIIDEDSPLDEKPLKRVWNTNRVSNEIFLNLQQDEVEFTDAVFRDIYKELIHQLEQETPVAIENLVNHPNTIIAQMVTDILMEEEKYSLSDWSKKEIYVKSKEENLPKMVTDVILNIRRVLIAKQIESLSQQLSEEQTNMDILQNINDYIGLKKIIFDKLNRVL